MCFNEKRASLASVAKWYHGLRHAHESGGFNWFIQALEIQRLWARSTCLVLDVICERPS